MTTQLQKTQKKQPFEPRAKRCVLCPKIADRDEKGPSVGNLYCTEHKWLINKKEVATKKNRPCSEHDKALPFSVHLSDEEASQ